MIRPMRDADANAEEEPLAVAEAEALVEPHVHVHAIASPPLNARTNKRSNAELFRTLIVGCSLFFEHHWETQPP